MIKSPKSSLLTKAHRLCLRSPLFCVSGITGTDLNQRVRSIMTLRSESLSTTKRLLLTALIMAAIAAPVLFGHIGAGLHAQSATEISGPKLEVASIRQVQPHALPDLMKGIGLTSIDPWGTNRFTARNVSLSVLIQIAYGIDGNRLSGKPGWLDSQLFDVSAKAEGDTGLTKEQMQPLLRQLLEQRFHLVTHTEKKEVQGYALVKTKGGAKLKSSTSESQPSGQIWEQGIKARHMPLASLASMLERPAGLPIIDKTGIQGDYDFDLNYSSLTDRDSNLPSIFVALQEQLGLKLESQKVTIETLVIDHVDKTPTEN